jgi:hypothetical protein
MQAATMDARIAATNSSEQPLGCDSSEISATAVCQDTVPTTSWRDFSARWMQTVNRFQTYRDPTTGGRHAVRLVPFIDREWNESTTAYRLEDAGGLSPEHWPEILLSLSAAEASGTDRPQTINELNDRLKALGNAMEPRNRIICLGASMGWETEARESVKTVAWRSAVSGPNCSLVLVDLTARTFTLSDGDARAKAFHELFDLESDEEKIRRAVEAIGRLCPLEVSLSAKTLADQFRLSEPTILLAMRQAAEEFRLHLDDVPGYGWVISS